MSIRVPRIQVDSRQSELSVTVYIQPFRPVVENSRRIGSRDQNHAESGGEGVLMTTRARPIKVLAPSSELRLNSEREGIDDRC